MGSRLSLFFLYLPSRVMIGFCVIIDARVSRLTCGLFVPLANDAFDHMCLAVSLEMETANDHA